MNSRQVERALRHIYGANETEIGCSECFDRLSGYVDREVAGNPVAAEQPDMKHHLEHCRVCDEEYEMLRELARLEARGQLPGIEELKSKL